MWLCDKYLIWIYYMCVFWYTNIEIKPKYCCNIRNDLKVSSWYQNKLLSFIIIIIKELQSIAFVVRNEVQNFLLFHDINLLQCIIKYYCRNMYVYIYIYIFNIFTIILQKGSIATIIDWLQLWNLCLQFF